MMRCYFIQHRRNSKGFRVFQKNSKQKCDTFAWLRIRYNHLKGAEILHRPKGLQKYSLRSTVPFVSSPCLRLVFASDLLASFASTLVAMWSEAACTVTSQCRPLKLSSIVPSSTSTAQRPPCPMEPPTDNQSR